MKTLLLAMLLMSCTVNRDLSQANRDLERMNDELAVLNAYADCSSRAYRYSDDIMETASRNKISFEESWDMYVDQCVKVSPLNPKGLPLKRK